MRYLLICLVLLFSSCGGDEPELLRKPDDLLSEEKLVAVLTDIHLLEGALALRSGGPRVVQPGIRRDPSLQMTIPDNNKAPLGYYDIFSRNGITFEQYEHTMQWYSGHPEELFDIYDRVLIGITRRQAEELAVRKDSVPAAPNPAR